MMRGLVFGTLLILAAAVSTVFWLLPNAGGWKVDEARALERRTAHELACAEARINGEPHEGCSDDEER
jgi:hypothetical protein